MSEWLCRTLVEGRAVSYDDSLHGQMGTLPCEQCGTWTHQYELHHRQFRSRGGPWVTSNIVLLCRTCHVAATDEAPWMQGAGLNVHTWEDPADVPVKLWYEDRPVLLDDLGGYTVVDLR